MLCPSELGEFCCIITTMGYKGTSWDDFKVIYEKMEYMPLEELS